MFDHLNSICGNYRLVKFTQLFNIAASIRQVGKLFEIQTIPPHMLVTNIHSSYIKDFRMNLEMSSFVSKL